MVAFQHSGLTYATVNVVTLNDPGTTDADIQNPHKLANLLDISLTGSRVTDGCINDLLRVRSLRSLNLMVSYFKNQQSTIIKSSIVNQSGANAFD